MSYGQEGWKLTTEEVSAIMALAGNRQFIGLAQERAPQPQLNDILNACCRLLQDQMMTQVDGRFRLSRELAEVMEQMCFARTVLALTPGSGRRGRRIFYAQRNVTMMEEGFQGVVLTWLEPKDVAEVLWQELESPVEAAEAEEPPEPPRAEADQTELLRHASLLLEKLDPQTGVRLAWLRIRRQDMQDRWMEWTRGTEVCQQPLNRQELQKTVEMMLRGESE